MLTLWDTFYESPLKDSQNPHKCTWSKGSYNSSLLGGYNKGRVFYWWFGASGIQCGGDLRNRGRIRIESSSVFIMGDEKCAKWVHPLWPSILMADGVARFTRWGPVHQGWYHVSLITFTYWSPGMNWMLGQQVYLSPVSGKQWHTETSKTMLEP